ncbi:hypothetical protein BDV25DRAFT_135687 [Aspergillus avenaceus]|uniref:Uncharacterized protein n=1 Tax=Aspergillus avenaceus TaxID=36643 RepID=A0A5N6U820_ASPAV|nr:hypothetical protein BDV25DRAFT_135687 [Aspergillus avenaceus]
MAAASPEGEAWFFHNAIKIDGKFEPTDPKQFYNHILLEVVTNWTVDEGFQMPELPFKDHPRADKQCWDPASRTFYTRYRYMTVMTGHTCEDIKRKKAVNGSFSFNDLARQTGKNMIALVPVLVPDINERYLWFTSRSVTLDAYESSTSWENELEERLSDLGNAVGGNIGSQIGGTAGSTLGAALDGSWAGDASDMMRNDPLLNAEFEKREKAMEKEDKPVQPAIKANQVTLPNHKTAGWEFQPQWTARFDIFALARLLAIPTHLLNPNYKDPYRFIKLYNCKSVACPKPEKADSNMNPEEVVQFDKLLSVQIGSNFTYQGNGQDPNFLVKVLSGLVAVGLSCIPMFGPLIALGEQLIVDAILDPDSFKSQQGLISKIPGVASAMAGTAQNASGYLSKTASLSHAPPVLALEEQDRRSIYVGPGEPGVVNVSVWQRMRVT